MSDTANQGLIMSGGSIQSGAFAVGSNAEAEASDVTIGSAKPDPQPWEKIQQQLQDLKAAITASNLPNRADLVDSANAVSAEVAKPKPNKVTLMGLLTGIAEAAKSVQTVAAAAEATKIAMAALF